jgi:glucose-6-phosphate 1-dehydrogenase
MLFNIQKLNDSKVCEVFQTIILDVIKKDYQGFYMNNDDIKILWSGIKNVIQK